MEVFRILIAVAITIGATNGKISPRIAGGIPVDTFTRFPHHVTIFTQTYSGKSWHCSGSIITDQWILTSLECVKGGSEFRLDFNRMHLNDSWGSYSAIVYNSAVVPYPTGFDDLALIKNPMKLVLSSNIKTIPLNQDGSDVGSNFAVMPGFSTEDGSDNLTYGMFEIVSNDRCENVYGSDFDKYLELCTFGWNNNRNVPCEENKGGGLITGWPRKPQIIGVFSKSLNCSNPAVYVEVSKYLPWINSIIEVSTDIPA